MCRCSGYLKYFNVFQNSKKKTKKFRDKWFSKGQKYSCKYALAFSLEMFGGKQDICTQESSRKQINMAKVSNSCLLRGFCL